MTFPAASIFAHPFSFDAAETGGYGSLDELVAHMIEIERELIADAVGAGCRYVQLDFPLYPYLVDPSWIAALRDRRPRPRRRWSSDRWPPTAPCSRGLPPA